MLFRSPSIGLLAGLASEGALVATFHASTARLRAFNAIVTPLDPLIERISGKIAVSEIARQTLKERFNTEAVVIPNGIHVEKFQRPQAKPEWSNGMKIGFLGRFNESRKGLELLVEALPKVLIRIPNLEVLVAGPGEVETAIKKIPLSLRKYFKFLGALSEEDKVSFFKSITAYVAPNTGGESFGIILAEAMASHTPIVSSDLPAFRSLLENGKFGSLFTSEDANSLSSQLIDLLENSEKQALFARQGYEKAKTLDWETVASNIFNVYELALATDKGVRLVSDKRLWNRFRSDD